MFIGIYPKDENSYPSKKLPMYVYGNFIHDHRNTEAAQIAFRRWMDKQIMVPLDSGLLFGDKNSQAWKHVKEL